MTYEEALMNRIAEALDVPRDVIEAGRSWSDAYRAVVEADRERFLSIAIDTAKRLYIETVAEHEAARTLADQLAAALKDSGADGHPAHNYPCWANGDHSTCGLCMEEEALAAYEARNWK